MGGLLSICSAASCACQICSCLSNTCNCISNCTRCGKSSTRARIQYFLMFFLFSLLAWILQKHGFEGLKRVGDMKNCDTAECTGTGIVLRMSMAMTLVASFLSVLVCGVNSSDSPRAVIQNDFFSVKWIMLAVTTVGCMFLTNESAVQFGYVAAVGAGIFLLIGVLLVLEFAYSWNDTWVQKYDDSGEKTWAYLIVGTALTLFSTSITIWALLIQYFGGDGCTETNAFVSVTVVLSVIVTLITLPNKVEQGAVLPCSVVVLYCTWLCASAVMSIPFDEESACQARHSRLSGKMEDLMKSLGVVFTILCVGYATVRAAESGNDLSGGKPKPSTGLIDKTETGEATGEVEKDEVDKVQYNYSFFQIIYALGAMYFAMVLLNWNIVIQEKHDTTLGHMSDWADVWIKMATQWAAFILYTWTLIAPLVCSGRDFS